MKLEAVICELKQLVKKTPEDITAKMQIYRLVMRIEKNGLPDKQAEKNFLEQMKRISRMTIDKEIFRTLERLNRSIQQDGLKA